MQPGENYFDRSSMTLYLVVRNNEHLDLKTSQTLIINMETVMEITPEELYTKKRLGPILASILNISSDHVKVVNIKSSLTGRKRRSDGSFQAELMFEVGNSGALDLGARSSSIVDDSLGLDELLAVQNKMFQSRTVCEIKSEMKKELNIDVVQVSVDGVDNDGTPSENRAEFTGFGGSDDDFNPFNSFGTNQTLPGHGKIVASPSSLNIFQEPSLDVKEGEQFAIQPWIELLDENGARVYSSEFTISVRLVIASDEVSISDLNKHSDKNSWRAENDEPLEGIRLTGQLSQRINQDGFAQFSDLGVQGTTTGVQLALEFYLEGAEVCGGGSLSMEKRSKGMKIESATDNNVVYCRAASSAFGRKKKKNKGGSSGSSVDCSGLDLIRLDDIITDLRIGGFIRVKLGDGKTQNIAKDKIITINLSNNKLSDGDNLKDFLSYLPSVTSITLDNNNFTRLPLSLTTNNLMYFSLKGNENLVSLDPGAIGLNQLEKKTIIEFPCSMEYIPLDLLVGSKSAVQGFLKAAKFC